MKYRSYILLLLVNLIVMTLFGCNVETTIPVEDKDSKDTLRIGFSQIESDNPWRTAQINSFREATNVDGMELIYHEPKEYTSQWQIDDINQLIETGIDYLVVVPREIESLIPILQDVKKKDIPVILIYQHTDEISKSLYISLISADYYKEGQLCALMLAKKFGDKRCNIIEIHGTQTSSMASARSKGFRNEIMKYPNLQIVENGYGNFNRVTARKAMGNALIAALDKHTEVDAVFAHSDEDGLGALHAIKAAGITTGEIAIVSINGVQDAYKAIIAGEYLGTVKSNPKWGQIAVNLINQYENNNKSFPVVFIPCSIINFENAYEQFEAAY